MELLGWLMSGLLVIMVTMFVTAVTTTGEWRKAIPFGLGVLVLLAGVVVLWFATTNKPFSPAPSVGPTGKDFYEVVLEETTITGKTVVVVKDSSGRFYVSEFDEPLAVKKILVVNQDKFKPLLSPEKSEQPKKKLESPLPLPPEKPDQLEEHLKELKQTLEEAERLEKKLKSPLEELEEKLKSHTEKLKQLPKVAPSSQN